MAGPNLQARGYPTTSALVGSRKALRQLQGLWFREDGELIAQIIDSLVIFEGNQVSRLSVLATNRFALEWEGREHVGTLEVDAQASLTWSDGDVWWPWIVFDDTAARHEWNHREHSRGSLRAVVKILLSWARTAASADATEVGSLSLSFAREAAANGSIIPLQQGALQEPLASGASRALDCHDIHWGLAGIGTVRCNGSQFEVATAGCVRSGCPWHRLSLADGGTTYQAPTRDLAVPGAVSQAPDKWTPPVLAWDGALYAAPLAADNVLRVAEGASGTEVTEIAPASALSGSFTKYGAAVLGGDGFVYCIPYSAQQVMRIDPGLAAEGNSSALQLFGDAGTAGYKWLHGVASQQGPIYAVPAGASTVLVIDTQSVSISELAIGQPLAASLQNYIHAVLSPEGDIFGVPADATFVLWIQPDSQAVTALGSLSADSLKWMHGIVAADGRIYCMPGSATAVLRIDPSASPPTLNLTLGEGLLDPLLTRKWSHAVNALDGRIFGIPQGAAQVLVIDPFTDSQGPKRASASARLGSHPQLLAAGRYGWPASMAPAAMATSPGQGEDGGKGPEGPEGSRMETEKSNPMWEEMSKTFKGQQFFDWARWKTGEGTCITSRQYHDLDDSLAFIQDLLRQHAPLDGVFGFSQGANMASLIAAQAVAGQGVNFGFVVHCCAAGPGWVEQRPELFAEKLPMRSLHISGKEDSNPELPLLALYDDPVSMCHSDGHKVIPSKGGREEADLVAKTIADFILSRGAV
ncbi:dfr1 [Symbiodinium natans]|uniref:Dfr1 protein n=1 Tax=Symbiodinium natans TaxID=878477 RepID=A0A812KKV8_9DINO|nr:dfr1 [Symbiodinium natans]